MREQAWESDAFLIKDTVGSLYHRKYTIIGKPEVCIDLHNRRITQTHTGVCPFRASLFSLKEPNMVMLCLLIRAKKIFSVPLEAFKTQHSF